MISDKECKAKIGEVDSQNICAKTDEGPCVKVAGFMKIYFTYYNIILK